LRFLLTLLGVVSLHLGANLANDYFDYVTGCDQANPEPTPFSGGSRVIQRGLVSSRRIVAASAACFGIGGILGLTLNAMVPGNRVLWLGLVGLVGGFLYSAVPVKLSYRGMGEAVVFTLFGPLTVAGAYLCQTGRLDALPFLASVPFGLWVLAILLVNEVLDVRWDALAGKRTLVVKLGGRWGYLAFLGAYFGGYAWLAIGSLARVYSPLALLALLPALLSARSLRPARALADRSATINASRLTVLSHTLSGLLVAACYLISALI
jgi:1,4-dihydroxy-2-naphthoate octaprenyltransferase